MKEKIIDFFGKSSVKLTSLTLLAGVIPMIILVLYLGMLSKDIEMQVGQKTNEDQKAQLADSDKVLRGIAESIIKDRANDAKQIIELYIKNRPHMNLSDFQKDKNFRMLVLRRFGKKKTGYMAMHDSNGISFLHTSPNVENKNLLLYAKNLPEFKAIIEQNISGKASGGYYHWVDAKDNYVEKYMYSIPLDITFPDNSQLFVAATMDIIEFTKNIEHAKQLFIEQNANILTTINDILSKGMKKAIVVMLVSLLVLAIISLLIGNFLSKSVVQLNKALNEIHAGNFVTVKNTATGDMKKLVNSFNKMVITLRETTVSKREVEEMALHDSLTMLRNRKFLSETFDSIIASARRNQKIFVVFFLDLDRFKMINDQYGHKVGDQALIMAADILKQLFRKTDIVARIGGDEFVVITEINRTEEAEIIMSKIKASFNNAFLKIENTEGIKNSVGISVSIGMAVYSQNSPNMLDELLNIADKNMYLDKRS